MTGKLESGVNKVRPNKRLYGPSCSAGGALSGARAAAGRRRSCSATSRSRRRASARGCSRTSRPRRSSPTLSCSSSSTSFRSGPCSPCDDPWNRRYPGSRWGEPCARARDARAWCVRARTGAPESASTSARSSLACSRRALAGPRVQGRAAPRRGGRQEVTLHNHFAQSGCVKRLCEAEEFSLSVAVWRRRRP